MVKAWCMWCENGNSTPKPGYFWIHMECWEKLQDWRGLAKWVEDHPEGLPEDFKEQWECAKEFQRKWSGTIEAMKAAGAYK